MAWNYIFHVVIHHIVPVCLAERGEGHVSQNEPSEDQLCDPQLRPLDRPSLLQPHGGQPDLQGDEEDGEDQGAEVQHRAARCYWAFYCRDFYLDIKLELALDHEKLSQFFVFSGL